MFLPAQERIATATAAIRQVSAEARADMHRLVSRTIRELNLHYKDAILQLREDILAYADTDGNLRLSELAALLTQVHATLGELGCARDELLLRGLTTAAEIGADLWYAANLKVATQALSRRAVKWVQSRRVGGLRLAERLVQLDQQTCQRVNATLKQAVISGQENRSGIRSGLEPSEPVPCSATPILQALEETLSGTPNSPYPLVLQLLRAEINYAHIVAYRAGMVVYADLVGERFIVSSCDPKVTVHDIHTQVDLYDLGPGVYPVGQSPWPLHPNALNFIEAVFANESSLGLILANRNLAL